LSFRESNSGSGEANLKRHFDTKQRAGTMPRPMRDLVRAVRRSLRGTTASCSLTGIRTELLSRGKKEKTRFRILAGMLIFLFILRGVAGNSYTSIAAEDLLTSTMQVHINEYAKLTSDSGYYAWRGAVHLTGNIPAENDFEQVVGYIDSDPAAIFSVSRENMVLKDGEMTFETILDVTRYKRGYHTIRIYSRQIQSFDEISPLWTLNTYFETLPFASITNVNEFCNMRSLATTSSSIVTTVKLGEEIELLGQVKGQLRPEYNTDIWYRVQYTALNGTVYNGYIVSALVRVLYIPDMMVSAQDAVFEKFQNEKFTYEIHLPFSISTFSVSDIVRYNPSDQIQIFLNSTEVFPPFTQLLLATGDNRIEILFQRGSGDTAMICRYIYQIRRIAESTETEFQKHLAMFPESYRHPLLELHSKYPNWIFTAFDTELDWDQVISAQNSGTTSLISVYTPPEYKKDDVIRDGTQFVVASQAAIEYYMDPRNFFDERRVFQFEILNYQPSIHTLAGVTRILSGSGLVGRETLFMDAGVESNVSPYHLASRSRQEVTVWNPVGLSAVARGDYIVPATSSFTGPKDKYFGMYNFYNIGTGSSTDIDLLIRRGLEFSLGNYSDGRPRPEEQRIRYIMPWDSEAKAITGGAIFIGSSYINRGQNTLYLQKFDVDPIDGLYVRQYMQNIQAPFHESSGAYNAYSGLGLLSESLLFRIPIYQNMPAMKSPKPEDTNKLNTLTVGEYSLTPAFNPSDSGPYTVVVPSDVEQITLSATSSNSLAVIEGIGEKTLEFGDGNNFLVTCTPQNEAVREYIVHVIRSLPEKSTENRLDSIDVGDLVLTPVFSPEYSGPYRAEVQSNTKEIPVDALPKDSLSQVAGIGMWPLDFGENEFYLTVTAEYGNVRTYTVNITRKFPDIDFGKLISTDQILRGIMPQTSVDQIIAQILAEPMMIRAYRLSGEELKENDLVGSGTTVKFFYKESLVDEYKVMILGDLNGDGRINSTDIALLRSHILRIRALDEMISLCADVNSDGKINSTDIAQVRSHILRLSEIKQNP
jgi:beta-N-acetylglucosaminidase